ncbi:MAG: methenyltetrahydrofolate cyclohydrolase [Legionellales bacterium]|nr:methenyltetrahydrofolate cyclohydrolase [Legionellales bacterium]
MIKDMTVQTFLDELASKASTPGGGGGAAIIGAIGAALIGMVANFTVGKKGYEDVNEEFITMLKKSEDLRSKLTDAIKDDVDVFNQVMSAYGMPKETDEQKQKRTESIQLALKDATDVPLACAKLCREVIDLCESAAEKGNANVVSDAGVALLAGYAGLRSAALNVYINIGGIKDEAFANDRRQQLESLLDGIEIHKEDVYELVKSKL